MKIVSENINKYLKPKTAEEILNNIELKIEEVHGKKYLRAYKKDGTKLSQRELDNFIANYKIPGLEPKVNYDKDRGNYVIDIYYKGEEVNNIWHMHFLNKKVLEEVYKKNFYLMDDVQYFKKMVEQGKEPEGELPHLIIGYISNKKIYNLYIEEYENLIKKSERLKEKEREYGINV